MKLCLKGTIVVLFTCQKIQYKVWKLSNYTARVTVRSQEMSKCTRGAGKRVNCYSTWYQNKGNTNLRVSILKGKWFSFQFVWNFQQDFRRSLLLFSNMWLKCKRWTATYWANWQMLKKHGCIFVWHQMILWITCGHTLWWLDHEVLQRCESVGGSIRR